MPVYIDDNLLEELKRELANLKQSGDTIWTTAPVPLHWPWENGITLQKGVLAPYFQHQFDQRTEDSNAISNMVLVSAITTCLLQPDPVCSAWLAD